MSSNTAENLEKFGLLMTLQAKEVDNKETVDSKTDKKKTLVKKTKTLNEKKYYQANKNFVLFEEIKALIVKAQLLYERDFVEKIKNAGKPKIMVLSGFFVNDYLFFPVFMERNNWKRSGE